MSQLGVESDSELTALLTEPTIASFAVKKPPQPTPGGKWSQYSITVHHGNTKYCADIAIRDYRNWAKRGGGKDLTEQASIIAYKDWLLDE